MVNDAGVSSIIEELSGRMNDMVFELDTIPVERAIVWTTFVGDGDQRDPDWGKPIVKDLREMRQRGIFLLPAHVFNAWKYPMYDKWSKKVSRLGQNYLQLVPVHEYEFPERSSDHYYTWNPAMFVKELGFEGRSMIIFGPVGSGKTERATANCEGLNELKEGQRREGSRSVFAQIRREKVHREFAINPVEKEGGPVARLGLWDARDIQFVANYSIYDRSPELPSPIKAKWHREELESSTLLKIAEGMEKGLFTHMVTDEAGMKLDRNRITSRIVTALRGKRRFIRKFDCSWQLLTQHEKTDLPDDVVEDATCIVRLLQPKEGPPKRGIFTIPGLMKERRLRDIPQAISRFDTGETPTLIVDLDVGTVVDYAALKQGEAERAGEEWGIAQRARCIKEACLKFRASAQDMAAGRSPVQIAEVKSILLGQQTHPSTHKPWTDDQLAQATGASNDAISSARADVRRILREKETKQVTSTKKEAVA